MRVAHVSVPPPCSNAACRKAILYSTVLTGVPISAVEVELYEKYPALAVSTMPV